MGTYARTINQYPRRTKGVRRLGKRRFNTTVIGYITGQTHAAKFCCGFARELVI